MLTILFVGRGADDDDRVVDDGGVDYKDRLINDIVRVDGLC